MRKTKKLVMAAGALLVLGSTSGCDIEKMEAYFAPDRRIPDGSSTTFDNVHSPELNPTGGDPTRRTPSQEINGSMNDSTFQKVPVTPVASTNMDSTTGYPTLASVPQKPDVQPTSELKGDMNSLVAQQKTADASRTNLMNDPNVTVMTSPQTGQLVANAADAVPPNAAPAAIQSAAATPETAAAAVPAAQNAAASAAAPDTSSDKGFTSWLHNMFSSDSKPDATAPAAAPDQIARHAPMENPSVSNNAAPATADASSSPAAVSSVTTTSGAPLLRAPSQVVAQTQPEEAPGLDSPPMQLTQPAPQPGQAAQIQAPVPATNVASNTPAPIVSSVNMENNFPIAHAEEPAAPQQQAAQQNIPAPQEAAPAAQPQQAANNSGNDGFGSWMNEIFGSKKDDQAAGNTAPAATATAAPVEAVPMAAAPVIAQTPATADMSTAAAAPASIATETATVNPAMPVTAAATAPVVAALAPAGSSLPSTASLQAPRDLGSPAINSQQLPDISQLASQNSAPVNLVQPSEYSDAPTSYSSNGYIADSRYAGRVHSDN